MTFRSNSTTRKRPPSWGRHFTDASGAGSSRRTPSPTPNKSPNNNHQEISLRSFRTGGGVGKPNAKKRPHHHAGRKKLPLPQRNNVMRRPRSAGATSISRLHHKAGGKNFATSAHDAPNKSRITSPKSTKNTSFNKYMQQQQHHISSPSSTPRQQNPNNHTHLLPPHFSPLFIPNYEASKAHLDQLVHHSHHFLSLERKYLLGKCHSSGDSNSADSPTTSGNLQHHISPSASRSSPPPYSHTPTHFPQNWRSLAKDQLSEACCNLINSIHHDPHTDKILILFVLMQSTYLLQYFLINDIIDALNEWIQLHPIQYIVTWYFKILRRTKWESVLKQDSDLSAYVDDLEPPHGFGTAPSKHQTKHSTTSSHDEYPSSTRETHKVFQRNDPLIQTIYDIFMNRHRDDLLLSTKALSVLTRLLPLHTLSAWIGDDWKRLVKLGLKSKVNGRRLVANNLLHTLRRYSEMDDWNMQHEIVRLAYQNFDEEETLKAIENLANTAQSSFEEVMLAGGFKLCFDNLSHSRARIRNHVLLLLRILCEHAPPSFLLFPFHMDMVIKMANHIQLQYEENGAENPLRNVANAFHIIASILKRPEFNSHPRIQDFHMVHSQIAAQNVLTSTFDEYTEEVQDLIIGAAACLRCALVGSIERSSYSLHHGILERIVYLVDHAPQPVFASLLNLVAPLCTSKFSAEILFQESDLAANQIIEVLRRHINDENQQIKSAARAGLQRVAHILKIDSDNLFEEYTPSNATFRYMSIPDHIVERTRKVKGFVYTRPTSARDIALYMKKLNLKHARSDEETNLLQSFERANQSLAGRRPASAVVHNPRAGYALNQKEERDAQIRASVSQSRNMNRSLEEKGTLISSLLNDRRRERSRMHGDGELLSRPFSASIVHSRRESSNDLLEYFGKTGGKTGGDVGGDTGTEVQKKTLQHAASPKRIQSAKREPLVSLKRKTPAIDYSKSPYSCVTPVRIDRAEFVDSPPFPDEMAALEKKRQRLKREQQKNANSYRVSSLNELESVVVQKRSKNGYDQSQAELLRLCGFCGNASFSIVYKCFTCEMIFCSFDCRNEAMIGFHSACSGKKKKSVEDDGG